MQPREEATMNTEGILRVDALSKAYATHTVLHEVSFTLDTGTIAVLAGGNGTGKSTLLRCLAGLAAYSGKASVCGHAVDGRPASRRLVGYLPQSVSLTDSATVGEVLDLFARLRGVDRDDALLPDGFLPPVERPIGILSGGQRQRVALAVALLGRPPLLLLDEPVANLDEHGREGFWQTLRALRDAGTAALIASPHPGDLAGIANRAVVLSDGAVVFDGPVDRLRPIVLPRPGAPEVEVRDAEGPAAEGRAQEEPA
jgi:ABC-type multidrug transport system ATPase subunit